MLKPNLKVKIAGTEWKVPLAPASGCFGVGASYAQLYDINVLGAVFSKGVSYEAWAGNATPRVCETPAGMLNAIGLQNGGVENFVVDEADGLKWFSNKAHDLPLYVNVCGHTNNEYVRVIERLESEATSGSIRGYELNVSCPNVGNSCLGIGQDAKLLENLVKEVRPHTKRTLIVKLTPNVTDIATLAKAAEGAGADAISAINTLQGLSIDIRTRKARLANNSSGGGGGLSGPAIRPIAVRAVAEIFKAVKIPIIGVGGISDWQSAVEFLLAGATGLAVGSANFRQPHILPVLIEELEKYCVINKVASVTELIGAYHQQQ